MNQPAENLIPEEKARTGFEEAERRIESALIATSTYLGIQSLGLTELPESLARLTNLQTLDLFDNHLTMVPEWLARLTNLKALRLSDNYLTALPESLGRLTNLQTLDLSDNELTMVPEWLARLTNLQTLELSYNQLTALPESLGQLTNLQTLYLPGNQLTALPESLGRLTNLRRLGLSDNRFTVLPESLGQLTKLEALALSGNRLTKVPETLLKLTKLELLSLHDNPGLGLPVEVLGPTFYAIAENAEKPKHPAEILEYYYRVVHSAKPVLEARIIVIGDGAAGKTSLIRQLLHGVPARQEEASTRDVVIEDWPGLELENPASGFKTPVSVHLWDFGGQNQMHAAHPYFFTARTLYLVVAEARKDQQDRVDYWMKMVAKYGGNARALIVINKAEGHAMALDRPKLLDRYRSNLPANTSDAFFATSCTEGTGIEELKSAIVQELKGMDQIWARWPPEWFKVKESILELRGLGKSRGGFTHLLRDWLNSSGRMGADGVETINDDDWRDICTNSGVLTEKERDELLEYLGNLGLVVCFPHDPRLSHLGVLNPEWVTRGIYPLLVETKIASKGGMLEMSDLVELLPRNRYPKEKHPWLIDLMKAFELAFEEDSGRLLLPGQLPVDSPDWAQPGKWSDAGTLHLELRYDAVLPESVISQFIVRRHKEVRQPGEWWRHGIALKRGTCEALVRAHVTEQEAKIELRLRGPRQDRRDFLSGVRETLRDPKDSTPPELHVILGKDCAPPYKDLLMYAEKARERDYIIDGQVVPVLLADVLDMVESPAEQAASREAAVNVAVHIDNRPDMSIKRYGNITNSPGAVQGQGIEQTIENSFNAQGTNAVALVNALRQEFDKLPPADAEKVRKQMEVIESSVEDLEAEKKKPQPRKGVLELRGKNLLEAAKACGQMAPSLLKTAHAVAEWFSSP